MIEPEVLPEPPDGTMVVVVTRGHTGLAYRDDRHAPGRNQWPCPSFARWTSWESLMWLALCVYLVPAEPVAGKVLWDGRVNPLGAPDAERPGGPTAKGES